MNRRLILSLAWLSLISSSGCAGWKQMVKPTSLTESREDREVEAVRDLEERRDAAQLAAALDRWKQGDVSRAEAMLGAIVSRRSDCADARVLLAEILWSHNDASAEQHLRAVLETNENRADVHHALGLVLDGTGRFEEAQQHLSKAAELEPENEVYRATKELLVAR